MAASRLSVALAGPLCLPEGPVAVLRPGPDDDLSALPDAVVVTGDAVRHHALKAAGMRLADTVRGVETVIVCLPRDKRFARALIAEAAQAGSLVVVTGAKTNGVDAIWREVKARVPVDGISKGHGRVFWFAPSGAFADWADPGLTPGPDGFLTQPGVFSADKIDPGSALLADALPKDLSGDVADLGAGWGYLARAILTRAEVTQLHLVEAEARALEAARANLTDPRSVFHWADAQVWRPEAPLDAIVMNPPFHAGRAASPDLGRGFIAAAAAGLAPRGTLWMVANRHLPYEAALAERFHEVEELPGNAAFKLFRASRPRRGSGVA